MAATASYLAVRQAKGTWLLRIEDLDKPREQPGAADAIIQTLSAYGFEWDGEILYQSQRQQAYQTALHSLAPHTYPCTCSRKTYGTIYPGTCRERHALPLTQQHAIRVRTHNEPICFTDAIQGEYCQRLESELGDFVIRRADGLFAYQLAVVVDDAFQGINQVVRGTDLLDNTPRQIWLQQLLGFPQPSYAHVPLVLNEYGQKLSKQNLAPALNTSARLQTLVAALRFLGQTCPDANEFATLTDLWDWAIAHWDMNMATSPWRTFPRWMLEEHETDLQFNAQLSTGRAAEVTARLQQEPATMPVLLKLLGDSSTALSTRIGIGVVMEDLAGSELLKQHVATLGKLSQHPDVNIRADACHYLGLSADATAIPFLQTCLQDRDLEVQEVAADALVQISQ